MTSFAHAALADTLHHVRGAVVAEAVRILYERHPEWDARWGVYGRELTARDTAFHLEFLEAALRAEDNAVFTRYSAWLATVLRSRNVPVQAAVESYELLDALLAPRLAPSEREQVSALLARGREALDGPAPVPGLRSAELPPRARLLVDALIAADRRRVQTILLEELEGSRSLAALADDLVQPAMSEIGRLWQENRLTVVQEHMATALMQTALARAAASAAFGAPSGRRALFACVEGNQHGMGLRMISDSFEQAGWEARFLGQDVPSRELVAAVREWEPHLLGLSISLPQHVATTRRLIDALRSTVGVRTPRIIVGGIPIVDFPGLARVIGADETFPDASSSMGARA
ncbi:MAG TPA: cobalamin-dependent protein [Candidatus Thermoplasmatota archaeon]|nr:cobalamin-dependent protein [Candidatus Thermoplasmatota archaeon]